MSKGNKGFPDGRLEAYQYNGICYEYMQNLLEAIFLNKVNK